MHPILFDRRRLAIYLTSWILLAAGLCAAMHVNGRLRQSWSLWLGLPAGVAYGFACLASWYPARALPAERTSVPRLLLVHGVGAAISTTFWLIALTLWAMLLGRTRAGAGILHGFYHQLPILIGFGMVTYLLTAGLHHLMAPAELSRRENRRSLEAELLAREAELKLLRAQIDPHYLFNTLHSIAALTQLDPPGARTMCILLADFLRLSLRLGSQREIELASELALVRSFLEIEKTRHGDRLRVEEQVAESAERCLVPPLLLQPLVENAVRHGIAGRVDGGCLRLSAAVADRVLHLRVENERDPEATASPGEGLGLQIVQRRLERIYRGQASLVTRAEGEWYRAEVRLPAERGGVLESGVDERSPLLESGKPPHRHGCS